MKSFSIAIGVVVLLVIGGIATGVVFLVLYLNSESSFKFPEDFKFGAASSSYQIEGGWNASGKTPSIWDTASHKQPSIIADQSTGDVAANSYEFYKKDVAAAKRIGLQFYRFSISWPRILPSGDGKVNQAGIDYYNNLINELIANDIEPMVTMYHWDLPQSLQDLGGWTNPLMINYFEKYADILFEHFGDRVKSWITFNEPYIFCMLGYGIGHHAPLIKSPGLGDYKCGHNVLLAHAKAYHVYKLKYLSRFNGEVGICNAVTYAYADYGIDSKYAEQYMDFYFGWFLHPIFTSEGGYPQIMIDVVKKNSEDEGRPWSRLPEFTNDEKNLLKGSADFLALNYYYSELVKPKTSLPEEPSHSKDAGMDVRTDENWRIGGNGSSVISIPQGLHDSLLLVKEKYGNAKVYITENGMGDDGRLNDETRILYLTQHLQAISNAINDGCNVEAYAVWSLLDNFEWRDGYSKRFGIYGVDFSTNEKERVPKMSADFYGNVIKSREL